MSPPWTFSVPPDAAAWGSVAAAVLVFVSWSFCAPWVSRHPKLVVTVLAAVAALLSLGYVHVYLRGGPRIIDATSYFLQARLLSQGNFGFEPLLPSGSFRGRFLTGPVDATTLAVIFPPGYPLLLSLGFLLGKPLWIGPLVAALLVVVSAALAWRLFRDRNVALTAAGLSALCAALRYHTADTMSHGWSALLLASLLLAVSFPGRTATLLGGVAAGWLVATRPVTGILGVALGLYWLKNLRSASWFALAMLPGLLLLLVQQHAVTGDWFSSSQRHYYALADSPPGCFRYGFGDDVGCRYEHGDVVAKYLAEGFWPWQAAVTSAHRLSWHILDVANLELLWLVVPFAAYAGRKQREIRLLTCGCVGIVLAYAPFYFNGSYPGGGARFFADVLPLEHVLLSWGVNRISQKMPLALPAAFSVTLLGFAFRAAPGHIALGDREGGRPMFSPADLAERGIDRGLVFVNTDHGFNIAFDPSRTNPKTSLVFARARGDAHDQLLWMNLGSPASYTYRFKPWSSAPGPIVRPYPLTVPSSFTFEAEYEWPAQRVAGSAVLPANVGVPCASNHQVLRWIPTPNSSASLSVELVAPEGRPRRLVLGWVHAEAAIQEFVSELDGHRQSHQIRFASNPCQEVELEAPVAPGRHLLTLEDARAVAELDYLRLLPGPDPK